MPGTGRDENGVSGGDFADFSTDLHDPLPFEDEVELLTEPVVVALGGLADGDGGFSEALVCYRCVRAV